MCDPVSGKPVLLWLKVALSHVEVLWQESQVCGKLEAT